ncbi:glutathione S-transferase family protein [Hoeflea prorocentri]|uniref:Glutathione S-transferase n=1 Tax=Hoeflea prorocentri TaxID=1922333 RepID=A0A9X3UGX6_9HYPH|nr:glutathione S-transferase [Hoeflea prorocentri]MCY6380270.1 glutathione S-transferase [Hoeflea prorocentri]MDA5398070.1 glutathione S-transferase [Hoeflea prorocentri]
MLLYDGGRAPNPRRVRIFLAEKGIEVPLKPVDMTALGHKSEEITALNPYQRLPVLMLDDGTVLTETVAICRYFEELHPEPPLMGIDALDRAKVEMWNRRMEFGLLSFVAMAFRHTHPAMAEWEVPQVKEFGEANRPKALKEMDFLDRELADRAFVTGDRYTIADITAMMGMDMLKPARIDRPVHLENLMRWYESVSSRPSASA